MAKQILNITLEENNGAIILKSHMEDESFAISVSNEDEVNYWIKKYTSQALTKVIENNKKTTKCTTKLQNA